MLTCSIRDGSVMKGRVSVVSPTGIPANRKSVRFGTDSNLEALACLLGS